jgi:hypothetical protein
MMFTSRAANLGLPFGMGTFESQFGKFAWWTHIFAYTFKMLKARQHRDITTKKKHGTRH